MPKRLSEQETLELVELSAREGNVLALTSRCDSRCIFCSHKNNPPELLVASVGTRALADVVETFSLLSPERPILIGESATRIIEGEPLLHPDFRDIIRRLRRRFPTTPIEITTNGCHLDADTADALATAGNVLINLSLNSASPDGRRLLMGDGAEKSAAALRAVELLNERGVSFSASLVAMPNVTGWDDIRETVLFLARRGARSVTVFAPAFSKYADAQFPDPLSMTAALERFADALGPLPCPVLTEPSETADLRAVVSACAVPSPASAAGLRRGDEIVSIDSRAPFSRVEAWRMLSAPGRYELEYLRGGERRACALDVTAPGGGGLAFEYDYDPERADFMRRCVYTAPGFTLMLCSEAAHGVLRAVAEKLALPGESYALVPVPNLTFGGSVRAAGLLCVSDYAAAFDAWREQHGLPGGVLLPYESFDYKGMDLKGESFETLRTHMGVPVTVG